MKFPVGMEQEPLNVTKALYVFYRESGIPKADENMAGLYENKFSGTLLPCLRPAIQLVLFVLFLKIHLEPASF
jgi:hypothetical protein